MDDQHDAYSKYIKAPDSIIDEIKGISKSFINACRLFPATVTFILVPVIPLGLAILSKS